MTGLASSLPARTDSTSAKPSEWRAPRMVRPWGSLTVGLRVTYTRARNMSLVLRVVRVGFDHLDLLDVVHGGQALEGDPLHGAHGAEHWVLPGPLRASLRPGRGPPRGLPPEAGDGLPQIGDGTVGTGDDSARGGVTRCWPVLLQVND